MLAASSRALLLLSLTSICSLVVAGSATGQTQTLVQYDPVGVHNPCVPPFNPTSVATVVAASPLSQAGFGCWSNTDVWPVGQIGPSPVPLTTQYIAFTVTPNTTVTFGTLSYSKRSYVGQGPRQAAVRTSLDGFASDVDTVTGLNPGGVDQILFDLGGLPSTSGKIEFRIYFFDAPLTGADWADLDSSNIGTSSGLILRGSDDVIFCTAKSNLACGTPSIMNAGVSSATASSGFTISAGPARTCKSGILIYNTAQFATAVPFQGGTLCVEAMGLRRAGPMNSMGTPGGANCDGQFSMDMNAFAQNQWVVPDCAGAPSGLPPTNAAGYLTTPGQDIFAQLWGRDSVATGSFVSDGLQYVVGP